MLNGRTGCSALTGNTPRVLEPERLTIRQGICQADESYRSYRGDAPS